MVQRSVKKFTERSSEEPLISGMLKIDRPLKMPEDILKNARRLSRMPPDGRWNSFWKSLSNAA
jgi:hypothetical protein